MDDPIISRLNKQQAQLLKTFAQIRDGGISISECRRRNRAAGRELASIRKDLKQEIVNKRDNEGTG
jgi:hypothetical protein